MKVKRMGIKEILRRVWLFSVNKIISSESFSKQQAQLIIAAHNCHIRIKLWHCRMYNVTSFQYLIKINSFIPVKNPRMIGDLFYGCLPCLLNSY